VAAVSRLAKMVTGTKFRDHLSQFVLVWVRENSSLSPHLPNRPFPPQAARKRFEKSLSGLSIRGFSFVELSEANHFEEKFR
jgi:hypothetical protein